MTFFCTPESIDTLVKLTVKFYKINGNLKDVLKIAFSVRCIDTNNGCADGFHGSHSQTLR